MSAKDSGLWSSPRKKDGKKSPKKSKKDQSSPTEGSEELQMLSSLAPPAILDAPAVTLTTKGPSTPSPNSKKLPSAKTNGEIPVLNLGSKEHGADSHTAPSNKRLAPTDEDEDMSYMEAAANLALLRDASPRTAALQKTSAAKRTPKGKAGSTKAHTPASASRSASKTAVQRKGPLWPTIATITGSRVSLEGVTTVEQAESVSMYTLLRAQMNPPGAVHRLSSAEDVPLAVGDGIPHSGYKPLRQPLPPPRTSAGPDLNPSTTPNHEELLRELVTRGRRVHEWWRLSRRENRGEFSHSTI